MNNRKAGVVYSGGLDSSVLLLYLREQGYDVYPLVFDDGSEFYLNRDRIAITGFLEAHGLSDKAQYIRTPNAEQFTKGKYIAGWKMMLQVLGMAWCEANEATDLCFGYTLENWDQPWRDQKPKFIEELGRMYVDTYMPDGKLRVWSPFLHSPKRVVVMMGFELNARMDLTLSCDDHDLYGLDRCGKCEDCVTRRDAFLALGMRDQMPPSNVRYYD